MGWKSTGERFAGADATLTFESLMPSGKALQACTSHDLGQNFSKVFGISFQTAEGGADEFAWQTSWGFSTRSIGGLILSHGDDNGLVLPPNMAPVQVAIVPVRPEPEIVEYCKQLRDALTAAGIRNVLDDRDDERFGFKLNKWEVKGVPITLKIGGQEAEKRSVSATARFGREDPPVRSG